MNTYQPSLQLYSDPDIVESRMANMGVPMDTIDATSMPEPEQVPVWCGAWITIEGWKANGYFIPPLEGLRCVMLSYIPANDVWKMSFREDARRSPFTPTFAGSSVTSLFHVQVYSQVYRPIVVRADNRRSIHDFYKNRYGKAEYAVIRNIQLPAWTKKWRMKRYRESIETTGWYSTICHS